MASGLFAFLAVPFASAEGVPTPDHVVIVIEENRSAEYVYGNPDFAYFNSLANNTAGIPTAKFTNYGGITHPSQPNYIALFSGQTVVEDNDQHLPSEFAGVSNIGAKLINSGRSFVGYSEDQPSVGSKVFESGLYAGRHNPWSNWDDDSIPIANRIPSESNRPFNGPGNWPAEDFANLPTLSIVVPNVVNDGHDAYDNTPDLWLSDHLADYAVWATTHNSLLIVTWDEDEGSGSIATTISGQGVQPGVYDAATNHYGLLRTLEEMYGLSHDTAHTQSAQTINAWLVPEPTAMLPAFLATALLTHRRRR